MTLKDFKLMNEYDQMAAFCTDGKYLLQKVCKNKLIQHYVIDSFSVCVTFDKRKNEIVELKGYECSIDI